MNMITIDGLREYGANVDEGLGRCMNMEDFYLKLVGKALNDPAFPALEEAIGKNDLDEAFEAAHRLKGALANLALTPLCEPVEEMVELLRGRTQTDYAPYIERINAKRKILEDMQ